MTEDREQQIIDGERIKAFLEDPSVRAAFKVLGERFFQDFKAANAHSLTQDAWAKARALEALQQELKAVVDRGYVAKVEQSRRQPRSR